MYDALIIGGGPAVLSAALSLGRTRRTAVVFDSGEYRNAMSSHAHTVPTHDHKDPAVIRGEMAAELREKYKTIEFSNVAAGLIREVDGIFELVDAEGKLWKGRKVVLAIGSRDILLDIPGYKESWGKSIFHCPLCRGFEEFGVANAAALIASESDADVNDALALAQLGRQNNDDITILTNGLSHLENSPDLKAAKACGFKVDSKKIKALKTVGDIPSITVEFEDESVVSFGYMIHSPATVASGTLAQQLGLELTPGGDIPVVDPIQQTSRNGVFAAGDCASPIKKVAVGMGTGVAAGAGVSWQLAVEELKQGYQ